MRSWGGRLKFAPPCRDPILAVALPGLQTPGVAPWGPVGGGVLWGPRTPAVAPGSWCPHPTASHCVPVPPCLRPLAFLSGAAPCGRVPVCPWPCPTPPAFLLLCPCAHRALSLSFAIPVPVLFCARCMLCLRAMVSHGVPCPTLSVLVSLSLSLSHAVRVSWCPCCCPCPMLTLSPGASGIPVSIPCSPRPMLSMFASPGVRIPVPAAVLVLWCPCPLVSLPVSPSHAVPVPCCPCPLVSLGIPVSLPCCLWSMLFLFPSRGVHIRVRAAVPVL